MADPDDPGDPSPALPAPRPDDEALAQEALDGDPSARGDGCALAEGDPSARGAGGTGRMLVLLTALAGLALLLLVAVRLAWLGDDAYITLRSVENWARGNGLRWNPDDRVQTYTHPLWMLLLSLGRALTGEVYFTTIGISLGLSAVAIGWLLLRARTVQGVVATAAMLLCARAFVEYATSGLETPLTYALLVAFVANVVRDGAPKVSRYTRAVLLASLLATNRMDLALLCLPPVLATMRGVPFASLWRRGLLASMPFLLWLAFAAVYYGSPLPVTAHAKAFGVGIPGADLAEQGLRYLLHTLLHDPALCATTVIGALVLLVPGRTRWLAFGALCYLAYVVKVGGGFMQGRFFLPPFVVVVASLAGWASRLDWKRTGWLCAVALGAMFAGGCPAWLRAPATDQPLSDDVVVAQHGIVDERRMYYAHLGLLSPTRAIPSFGSLERLAFPGGRDERWFLLNGAVGSAGFTAGAEGHVVDPLLCDPLIARLPARDPGSWRIGHVLRRIPEGYWETLATGENRLHHPGLRRYYEGLRLLTRAPVFDGGRLAALLAAPFGGDDDGLRAFVAEQYYDPPRLEVAAADVAAELAPGTFWFDEPRMRVVYRGGLAVRFDAPVTARELRLQVLGMCTFRCRFVQAGEVYGEVVGAPLGPAPGLTPLQVVAGLRVERVVVPDEVPQFDTLWLDYVEGPMSDKATGPPALGAVLLPQ